MARHISILSLLLSVYLMSASAWGLALGDIDLKSNLNQPFRAEITVEGANRDDVTGLTVQLASRAAFDRLGLDYPEYLQGFNLRTELRPDGNAVVIVTSSASVTEPFVTILVEAVWARGRLLREYTVFLDPPTFVAPAPAPAPVQAPSTTPCPACRAGRSACRSAFRCAGRQLPGAAKRHLVEDCRSLPARQ